MGLIELGYQSGYHLFQNPRDWTKDEREHVAKHGPSVYDSATLAGAGGTLIGSGALMKGKYHRREALRTARSIERDAKILGDVTDVPPYLDKKIKKGFRHVDKALSHKRVGTALLKGGLVVGGVGLAGKLMQRRKRRLKEERRRLQGR